MQYTVYLSYILLIIGLIVSIKIHYWTFISKQGFKSEAPEGFLRHPNLYAMVNILFFLFILFFTEIPWYIVVIFYFLSIFIGGNLAGKKYKEIESEMNKTKIGINN